jgi:hypothetical protein
VAMDPVERLTCPASFYFKGLMHPPTSGRAMGCFGGYEDEYDRCTKTAAYSYLI